MLLSWCSTCSFSRRQPGPFALHVLSKLNQTELESNPNSFFSPSWKSDYVDSHLLKYWEVPSLLVLGQMVSALLHQWGWSRTGSLRGPDTRASTAEALHYLPSSHPSFCIRWSDLHCWDYRGCDVVIYTNTFLFSKEAGHHLRNPNPSEHAHLQE